jgi:hypothetical protein
LGDTGLEGEDAAAAEEGLKELADAFKFRFEITLPGHIAESNADFLPDDSTAVWTIDFANPNRTLTARSEPGDGEGQSSNPAATESEGNAAAQPVLESDGGSSDGGSDAAAQSGDGDTGGSGGDSDSKAGVIIGIIVAIVVIGGIVFLIARAKKKPAAGTGAPGYGAPGGFPPPGASQYGSPAGGAGAPWQQGGGVLTAPPPAAPPVAPAQASPPNWHPDPTGRHELRYHDGTRWTGHVSDRGVTTSDPI